MRTAGSVSGLSSIMKRSVDDNRPVNKLVDDSEGFRNFTEIKQTFLTKFFSFEELLQCMLSTVRPGSETKIMFKDFERAVSVSAGTGHYSAFQLKTVFQVYSENQDQGIDKAFISLRDFKDLFYPHRAWQGDYTTGNNNASKMATAAKKQNAMRGVDDEDEMLSECSMMIDDIMQGKAIDDILHAREVEERKQLVEEELER